MNSTARKHDLRRLLQPKSIVVVGVSREPGSLGEIQVANFERFGFAGDIHIVSRNRRDLNGRPCVSTIAEVPYGIDAAIVCVPRAGVVGTLEELAARGVGAAMVYAAGFAEQDDEGRRSQEQMAEISVRTGMAINGPNCLGLTNFVDGIPYAYSPVAAVPKPAPGATAVAIVAQSGAMMVNFARAMVYRGVPILLQASTGNEAVLGIEDYLEYLLSRGQRGPIALFAEQLRQPKRFRELAQQARILGRPILLLHSGRSHRARVAAASHTGAVAGDFVVMRAAVESDGVLIVDDMDALVEVAALLTRFPDAPRGSLAVTTDSGAVKGLVIDACDSLNVGLAEYSPPTMDALGEALPSFASVTNPLDLTAAILTDPLLYERAATALLDDTNIGALLMVLQPGANLRWLQENGLFDALESTKKPAMLTLPTSDYSWPDELLARMRQGGILFTGAYTRALTALALVTEYRDRLARLETATDHRGAIATGETARLEAGSLPEYRGKALVAQAGIPTPRGVLVTTLSDALAAASRITYPVVLKAQGRELTHKSDVGGVALGITSPSTLEAAWKQMTQRLNEVAPHAQLDGFLVEAMAAAGLEFVVGAKRDRDWGTVIMAGLGGIWIEVFADVQLFSADVPRVEIAARLRRLKGATLLDGARGRDPLDIDAIIEVILQLGAVMRLYPDITEIDINPLTVYRRGEGVKALDVLVVS